MPILFSLVANLNLPDAYVASRPVNNRPLNLLFIQKIMTRIPEQEKKTRKAFSHPEFDIHVEISGDVIVFALTDSATNERLAFAFVEDVLRSYKELTLEKGEGKATNLTGDLLEKYMDQYNDETAIRNERLQQYPGDVKQLENNDIEDLLDNPEDIDLLLQYVRKVVPSSCVIC
ncbi:vamp7B [Acrasis kona]|uniref:Vamp7B n=1 Tax=Acrasis kona TaxID=1008807 RepID=A0AAW2YK19_9EUKA